MEHRGECPHCVDPLPTKDHIVGGRAVKHNKCDVEVDSSCANWKGVVPQCKLILSTKLNEDRGVAMNVKLIYDHLPQSIEKDDIGG